MAHVREIAYHGDGIVMRGQLAVPDGDGPFPGVLVAHGANGLDDFQAERAARLADQGYVTFALDYHGGRTVFNDRDLMAAELQKIAADPDRIRARARAALEALLHAPRVDPARIAAIGFCFGETLVMELARTGADLEAVVGFHPGLNIFRPGESRHIKGRVLMCVGADDPLVPLETRTAFEDEMRAARIDWQMILYGGVVHNFTQPRSETLGIPGLKYDQKAAERSWRAMLELFQEVF